MKMIEKKFLGRQGIPYGKATAGIGYIIIPNDVDRDKYVKNCLQTHTVMMKGEDGDFNKQVFVDKNVMKEIVFPETSKDLGSPVVWVMIPKHAEPVIVSVLKFKDDVSDITNERQIKFQKKSKKGYVDIDGKADEGQLIFTVVGYDETTGKIILNVINSNGSAIFKINVKGDLVVNGNRIFSANSYNEVALNVKDNNDENLAFFSYKKGVGWNLKDEWGNEIVTKDGEINIGGNSQKAVLGNKLKTFLDDLITEISSSTVTTALGIMPLMNSTRIAAFKQKTDELLSELVNLK